MVAPFSEQVTNPQWRRRADEWIHGQLARRGIRVTGEIAQLRARPWSTQLTVPTEAGPIWFKGNAPGFVFEAALQGEIARLVPGAVQAPLAIEPEQGWMLTADHGPTMGDTEHPDTDEWIELLLHAARVQRELIGHRETLLATGLPQRGPEHVLALFDRLRTQLCEYPADHPAHLDARDDRLFEAARPALQQAARRLADSGLPSTWNHGDLHPFNAYRSNGTVRFFDLGDGTWAHPLEILAVPLAWMRRQGAWPGGASSVDPDAVTAAYIASWGLRPSLARTLLDDMLLVHAVNRAQTWVSALDGATPAELAEYGGYGEEQITSVLVLLGMRQAPESQDSRA